MANHQKPKVTYKELTQHMQEKGISFSITSKAEAVHFFSKNNYYFKLTSYRKNFPKQNQKYTNLDFAYLVDLSVIDTRLRSLLLQLSLDVEHAIKVKLLDLIATDKNDDGYQIVNDFFSQNDYVKRKVDSFLAHTAYLRDLYVKRSQDPSIWLIIEIMPMGCLSQFLDFYINRTTIHSLDSIQANLKFIKNIRNTCAHGNPILVNLFSSEESIPFPSSRVVGEAANFGIKRSLVQDMKIHDIVALFATYRKLSSKQAREHSKNNCQKVLRRMKRHPDYYVQIPSIKNFIDTFEKLADHL